jgi:hypothetical protein
MKKGKGNAAELGISEERFLTLPPFEDGVKGSGTERNRLIRKK